MAADHDGDFAARNVRFFRTLALVGGVGVVIAVIFGLGMKNLDTVEGPFSATSLSRALLLAVFVLATVIILFLLRIGVIFDVEKQVGRMFASESERLEDLRMSDQEANKLFRDDMKRELSDLREFVRKDQAAQDIRVGEAVKAAGKAETAMKDVLAALEAMKREPAYRSAIEALQTQSGELQKEVLELKRRDNLNSPLLKELQEAVAALQKNQSKLVQRVDEALEAMERREMEGAALRAQMELDVGNLKKREQLLLVKQKELEDLNSDLSRSAKGQKIVIPPGEEKEHILKIEGIGEAFAARLHAQGVITIPQLLAVDAQGMAAKIDATPELVAEWQAMGQLLRVKGIGPQTAEVLVRAGIRSVKQLAAEDPEALSAKCRDVERGRKSRIQGTDVSAGVAKRWIDAARQA